MQLHILLISTRIAKRLKIKLRQKAHFGISLNSISAFDGALFILVSLVACQKFLKRM